jgi:hypothetical protein
MKSMPDLRFYRATVLITLVTMSMVPAMAQKTVVQEAGGERKIELQYNAAGQVTQIRTIGSDGQLLQKQDLEYPAGSYVPQTTATSYWPNGKVHKITRDTYDNNANFTGEFIQVFDDSGKQTAGHDLKHDPQTNMYQCKEWNTAAQKYVEIECPAGEESSGAPETVKKFTRDEVMQQLAQAKQTRLEPARTTAPAAPAAQTGTNVKEVGLILPANIRPGERVSGSVVENPSDYEAEEGIRVTRVALPFAPSGAGSTLAGWMLELSGEAPQAADGPIALTIPPGQLELAILFRQKGNEGSPVSKAISLPRATSSKTKKPSSYEAQAICFKGQVCEIRGPFGGDSSKTFVAFEQRPAKVLAETSDAAYVAVPERTEAGPRPMIVAEGSKVIAFPMVVAQFSLNPDRRDLKQGEKMLVYPTIEGPEELPDPLWQAGNFPASNLVEARKLIPGFQLPHASREARERREEEEKREAKGKPPGASAKDEEDMGGEILLVVKNLTPEQATFHESKNGTFVFQLRASSFKMGEFKYKFVVEALKTGDFGVKGYVIPFLAPVEGQEFAATIASAE